MRRCECDAGENRVELGDGGAGVHGDQVIVDGDNPGQVPDVEHVVVGAGNVGRALRRPHHPHLQGEGVSSVSPGDELYERMRSTLRRSADLTIPLQR